MVVICKNVASCVQNLPFFKTNLPSAIYMDNGQANEDCSCYSYDARKLDEAKCVHKDHVSAV